MTKPLRPNVPFSQTLHKWLTGSHSKTLLSLSRLFGEKSFAILFLLLMALPALPIPTGGITHVTEIIVLLLSLELIAGRRTVWLPKRWSEANISKFLNGRAIQKFIATIKWFERFSRQRWGEMLANKIVLSAVGLIVFVFTLAALLAPPFSGLDTLPALGVVVIALALILEDAAFLAAGVLIGILGIGLEITTGAALYKGLTHFF